MRVSLPGAFFRAAVDSAQVLEVLSSKLNYRGELAGTKNLPLTGVCDSRKGGHRQLIFTSRGDYSGAGKLTESLILIDELPAELECGSNQFLRVSDPRAAFIDVLEWFISLIGLDAHFPRFSELATISPEATVSESASIEPGVEIGPGCFVGSGAVIKTGTRIGENTIIRENTVIGSDGVTVYRALDGRLLKFPHVGGVEIGKGAEIGANTVVAGGILAPTCIGRDVVIGNLCNVGHGAVVGDGVWMSVGSLIGGHTVIQSGSTIAMGVVIRDNLVIGEGASLGMGSVIVKSVEAGYSMFGNPAKRMPRLKTGPRR